MSTFPARALASLRRGLVVYRAARSRVKGEGIRVVMCRARTSEGRWPRHRPIVPGGCPPSIVGAGAFHDRVRDGNGWVRPARATKATGGRCPRSPCCSGCGRESILAAPRRARADGAEPSAISTAPLRPSRGLHARPIDQLVWLGPYLVDLVGTLISGRASRLDAFSGYPCRTSATRRCRWRDNRYTGGPSVPVLSY